MIIGLEDKMKEDIYKEIHRALSAMPPETGGILGSRDGQILSFYFDEKGSCSEKQYVPDVDTLNRQIQMWQKEEIEFAGIVHSHWENEQLSAQDLRYAREVVRAFGYAILMGVYVYNTGKLFLYEVSEKLYKQANPNATAGDANAQNDGNVYDADYKVEEDGENK